MKNLLILLKQVIIPEVNDSKEYIHDLAIFLNQNINNIKKVDFLPFHTLGFKKYMDLNIKNPYLNKKALDEKKCNELYEEFKKEYKKEY